MEPVRNPALALARAWYVVLAVAVGCAVLAGAVAEALPKTYTSVSRLQVRQNSSTDADPTGSPTSEDPARVATTQRLLLLSDAVINPTASQLKTTPLDLRNHVQVVADAESDVLQMSTSASSAVQAQRIGTTLWAVYTTVATATGKATLQKAIDDGQAMIAGTPPAQRAAVQAAELPQLQGWQTRLNAYIPPLIQVTASDLPTGPSSASARKAGTLGLVFGLLLGAVVALLWSSRRDRLGRPDEVVTLAGLPELARLSLRDGERRLLDADTDATLEPVLAAARRAEVLLTHDVERRRGGTDGEGLLVLLVQTSTGWPQHALARALCDVAQASERRAVLVGAGGSTPDRPALPVTDLAIIADEPGLAEAVSERGQLDPRTSPAAAPRSWSNMQDALRSPTAAPALRSLAAYADLVVVDGPAAGDPATLALAGYVDAVVLVSDTTAERRHALTDALAGLRGVDAPLVGVVTVVPAGRDAGPARTTVLERPAPRPMVRRPTAPVAVPAAPVMTAPVMTMPVRTPPPAPAPYAAPTIDLTDPPAPTPPRQPDVDLTAVDAELVDAAVEAADAADGQDVWEWATTGSNGHESPGANGHNGNGRPSDSIWLPSRS